MGTSQFHGVLRSIKTYVDFVETLHDALANVRADLISEQEGTALHFAVDFAELYAYGHRVLSPGELSGLPDEPEDHRIARGQMALAYLFSDRFPRLALLPPYMLELKNHIRDVHANAEKASSILKEVALQHEKLIRTLRLSPYYDRVFAAAARFERGEALTDGDYAYASKFCLDNLKIAFAWLDGLDQVNAVKWMADLVKSGQLVPYEDFFVSAPPYDSADVALAADVFYRKLTFSDRADGYNAYIDAMACAILLMLREWARAHKARVLLVTHSRKMTAMLRALHNDRASVAEDLHLRDLSYCLARMCHARPLLRESLECVERSHVALDTLMPTCRSLRATADRCESESDLETAKNALSKALDAFSAISEMTPELRRMLVATENRDLSTSSEAAALWARSANVANVRRDTEVSRLLMNLLMQRSAPLMEAIEEESKVVLERLAIETERFNETTRRVSDAIELTLANEEELEALRSLKTEEDAVLVARIPGEPAIPLSLSGQDAVAYVSLIERFGLESGPTDEMRVRLVEAAIKERASGEVHLVLGYVFSVLGQWPNALDRVNAGLKQMASGSPPALALTRLKCVLLRKLWRYDDGLELCRDALKRWPNDGWILRESAVMTWEKCEREASGLDDFAASVNSAIECAVAASRAAKSKELLVQTLNTLAYLYCARSGPGDIERALSTMERLTKSLPETDWPGRFFDTRGYLRFKRAMTLDDENRRADLFRQAEVDYQRALKDPGIIDPEREVLEGHLRELAAAFKLTSAQN